MVSEEKREGGFSKESMIRKLRSLQGSKESIQGLSGWIRHYQSAHSAAILELWLKELRRNQDADQVLNFMHLANDVIQNSVRKSADLKFATDFFGILGGAMEHVATVCDEEKKKKISRILAIWDERKTFPSKQIQTLREILSGKLKPSRENHHHHNLHERHNLLKSPTKESLPTVTSVEMELEMEQRGPSCSVSVEDREHDMKKLSKLSNEVVEYLKKLQDPPSVDGDTRRKLAEYPPAVSDPAFLKEISNEAQADELLEKVKEAHGILSAFCGKLSAELEDRRKLQTLIADYEQVIKLELPHNVVSGHAVNRKLETLIAERDEVLLHYNSMPDIDELVPRDNTAMPSLVDLFRSQ